MKKIKPKILFLVTEDWYFWSHRLPIARAAQQKGMDVTVVTRVGNCGEKIKNEGFRLVPLNIDRSGRNPFRELLTLCALIGIYIKEKPDIVHHVALKPVLYGSWAAIITRSPGIVNALAGLGHVFIAEGGKASVLKFFVKLAFRSALWPRNSRTIFQNPDDFNAFFHAGLLSSQQMRLIKGSGVNIEEFSPISGDSIPAGVPIVVLVARMLWTKGVNEFVCAANILKQRNIAARMVLVGSPDPKNPASVSEEQLNDWVDTGCVEYWGHREDIADVLKQASVSVLPSYREGLPKSLIESAATALPLVAFDVPGCREIVRHEVNGLLVPLRNSELLANAIERLLIDPLLCREMGNTGRKMVVEEFSEKRVVDNTFAVYQELLP